MESTENMNEQLSIQLDGETYTAQYVIDEDDTVTVFLPDGSMRSTTLRGLKPEMAVRTHLKSFAVSKQKEKAERRRSG